MSEEAVIIFSMMNAEENTAATATSSSSFVGSTHTGTSNYPTMTPEKEAEVSPDSPQSLDKTMSSPPAPVFSPCASAAAVAAVATASHLTNPEEELTEEQLRSSNNENKEQLGTIVSALPSPPVNSSYSYYGPSFTAARNFNQTNHAMMQTIKTFPEKLHQILEAAVQNGMGDVISFFPHGRSFKVHKPNRFVKEIMPRFFKQTKLTSFQRQLNLYGFKRISKGAENGGYFHPMFLQGQPHLADQIKRQTQSKSSSKQTKTPPSDPKATPAAPRPSYYMPTYNYSHSSHGGTATPSYYAPPSMVPPSGVPYPMQYHAYYGWPPGTYGMPPMHTPMAYHAPPSASSRHQGGTTDKTTSQKKSPKGMPRVSPSISTPSSVSFTPIKLSAVDNLTWTPGALCLDKYAVDAPEE